jgi:hypothetical protein
MFPAMFMLMRHWWLPVVMFFIGGYFGIFLMGLMRIAQADDESATRYVEKSEAPGAIYHLKESAAAERHF